MQYGEPKKSKNYLLNMQLCSTECCLSDQMLSHVLVKLLN